MIRLIFILSLLGCSISVYSQTTKVQISTNMGKMEFILYDDTPKHKNAFLQLVNENYFDETLFYRVIQDFLIQGGSKSSKNAPPGKRIGYGDPDKTVDDEILPHYFHKKGALCAPRQPDDINPFKQSDISQFFIIKGRVYSEGELDTMEIVVNRPIRNKIINKYMNEEARAQLKYLRENKMVDEFREVAEQIKQQIETEYKLQTGLLHFSDKQREAYTSIGGYPELDGQYTIFGECVSGFETIDKIASLPTDENNRPIKDVKITVTVLSK
jgi:cyclophilin family peptidyl-prolyl cis-trans isomerase